MLKALAGFRAAGLRRVYLEVTAQNVRAVRLYRVLGFRLARTMFKQVDAPLPPRDTPGASDGGNAPTRLAEAGHYERQHEPAEVFASANMAHPLALAKDGKAGPVVLFVRNETCAFARPGLDVTSNTLLAQMLDPKLKLGTSTPKTDPSGDYAWQVFAKAEALKPGARATLEGKALQLVGGPNSAPIPPDRNGYGHLLATGAADLFLGYCTNADPIAREQPGIRMVRLPEKLLVGADYGLTVLNGASPNAYRLAMYILSPEGQRILARHGFVAPGLPRER